VEELIDQTYFLKLKGENRKVVIKPFVKN